MPQVFKDTYPRCRVIIDCPEFFIEKSLNHTARAQKWSNYKLHHTVKLLVWITPTGCISFVYRYWGGRVSDKQLTIESGFLHKIEFGDQVLADRWFTITEEVANQGAELRQFTITEEVANQGAELIIPAFTHGKKQLPQCEQEISRQISRVRMHVERVMQWIKT